ncbi:MAG: arginine deiminase [Peptoniphilaceae bacterium]|nr:arginine deiminase [Peptoniphilaceae bacterium]MDD7383075.1 arginine deiminase [Peptoniphilaceae bacterium]MDY3737511.1 arginine deiminase [Peptoniphilaceae bacterium]
MKPINVKNEISPLKKVLLHRPGNELLNLTPQRLKELLFDDIPFLKLAQKEHDIFADILRNENVEVVYLEDLMAQTLDDNPNLREEFIHKLIEESDICVKKYKKCVFDFLNSIKDNKSLVLKTMEGINLKELEIKSDDSLSEMILDNNKMILDPMPNLYFTRDNFASAGNGIILNAMYSKTRSRETIYAHYIFSYHKDYKDKVELFYNRDFPYHIEGGDILILNEKTLGVGISQRTEPPAIDALAKNIFFNSKQNEFDTIVAFEIPKKRAFMHLDTVFTQIDVDKFTVHPGILGTLRVFEIKKINDKEIKINLIENTLEHILEKYMKREIKLILCGGGDEIAADREQWNDGSNTLCIKPGRVVVYERNLVTNDLLEKNGIEVIRMPSSELSRGRGGPRCMSMPLIRED